MEMQEEIAPECVTEIANEMFVVCAVETLKTQMIVV
jgi:hypothetical protein